jgi:hypothetical protein
MLKNPVYSTSVKAMKPIPKNEITPDTANQKPLTRREANEGVRKLMRLLLEAPETVTELFETQELVDWLNHIVIPMNDRKLTKEYKYALDKYLAYVAVYNLSLPGV